LIFNLNRLIGLIRFLYIDYLNTKMKRESINDKYIVLYNIKYYPIKLLSY